MGDNELPDLADRGQEAIRSLRSMSPSPFEGYIEKIKINLRTFRVLPAGIASVADGKLYRGQTVLLGLAARGHDLTLGAAQTLAAHNYHAWAASTRALSETACALAYVQEAPDRLLDLGSDEAPSAGKIINAGKRRIDGIDVDYDRLSGVVHPRRSSLLLGFSVIEDTAGSSGEWYGSYSIPTPKLGAENVDHMCRATGILGAWCVKLTKEIVEADPDPLTAGGADATLDAEVFEGEDP